MGIEIHKNSGNSTDLWEEIFSQREQVWLRVKSTSMAPLIPEGAHILVKCREEQKIGLGDIVLFRNSNEFVAHRVLAVFPSKNKFLQCGDYVSSSSFISFDSILGVVEKVKVCDRETDFKSFSGRLLNIVIGIVSLVTVSIRKIWPKAGNLLNSLKFRMINLIMNKT